MIRDKIMPSSLVLLSILAGPAWAGDNEFQLTTGSTFFTVSPPCPVKQFPAFESFVAVPEIVDPLEQDMISVSCQIRVEREGKGVKNAKGNSTLVFWEYDEVTGVVSRNPLGGGKFKTNKDGLANFEWTIPTDIFADGFESGDVSAWSSTRVDFSSKKKAGEATLSCGTGSGTSSN